MPYWRHEFIVLDDKFPNAPSTVAGIFTKRPDPRAEKNITKYPPEFQISTIMTSLPSNLPEASQAIPEYDPVYKTCLRVERALSKLLAEKNHEQKTQLTTELIYIRILGYLLHFIPSRTGLDSLARQIKECSSDNDLLQLGQMYYDQYLRPFVFDNDGIVRFTSGRTSGSSRSSPMSRPSFDTLADMMTAYLTGEATPESFSTVKKTALVRDGFRGVISGSYDSTALDANEQLRNQRLAQKPLPRRVFTECVHIFPASINQEIPLGSDENIQASMLWKVLQGFGYTTLPDELEGAKIHRLENVMTLEANLHFFFDRLQLWFVATGEPNQYTIRNVYGSEFECEGTVVTFKSSKPDLPPPSPVYLAIHAACAQVAHLSGAAKLMDQYEREMEDGLVLCPSGDSAGLLDHALRGLKVAGY
ncbi:hypothetical protein D9613_012063 [Agrocybe pediades]|uniref:HNH nuclease domain-containing protein n=1 Tax=Agrocybe pediades TaxID=84607 RepID=A0A8H4QFZ7_9AGAR|nr:hypothetical protein D9613_012063 [Agrocybe pediades]